MSLTFNSFGVDMFSSKSPLVFIEPFATISEFSVEAYNILLPLVAVRVNPFTL